MISSPHSQNVRLFRVRVHADADGRTGARAHEPRDFRLQAVTCREFTVQAGERRLHRGVLARARRHQVARDPLLVREDAIPERVGEMRLAHLPSLGEPLG